MADGDLAALEVGKAAEHLVCCDLMLRGYRVFLSDQGLPYDVLVDLGGRFIRVQVKATQRAKNTRARGRAANCCYVFNPRRRGRAGQQRLGPHDCDIVALVALDIRAVAYLPLDRVPTCVELYPPGYALTAMSHKFKHTIDGYPFAAALSAIGG